MYHIKHELNKKQLISVAQNYFKTSDVCEVIESSDRKNFHVIFGCSPYETIEKDILNRISFEELPKNTYFAVGFDVPKGTGFIHTFSETNGTFLTPIYVSKTNEVFTDETRAGQTIKTGQTIENILTKL